MSTFADIAAMARTLQVPMQPFGLIEELAKAMERLEYNIAVQLAFIGLKGPVDPELAPHLIGNYVRLLRAEIPSGATLPK